MDISWVPSEYLHLTSLGRLGLCRGPGSAKASTAEDLDVLVNEGVGEVICLQEAQELARLEPPETILERQRETLRRGMRFLHEPIEDFGAPTVAQGQRLVREISAALDQGESVVVHCWAGLGRTGTVVACVLAARGLSVDGAVKMVRWVRPGAIQTPLQEAFVSAFAHLLHATRPGRGGSHAGS